MLAGRTAGEAFSLRSKCLPKNQSYPDKPVFSLPLLVTSQVPARFEVPLLSAFSRFLLINAFILEFLTFLLLQLIVSIILVVFFPLLLNVFIFILF